MPYVLSFLDVVIYSIKYLVKVNKNASTITTIIQIFSIFLFNELMHGWSNVFVRNQNED